MADPTKKSLTTFSPELARLVRQFVRDEIAKRPQVPGTAPAPGRHYAEKTCHARITDTATDSDTGVVKHAWKEQRWNIGTGDWEDAPGGKTGTTDSNYVINQPATSALNVDDVVYVRRRDGGGNDSDSRLSVWVVVNGTSPYCYLSPNGDDTYDAYASEDLSGTPLATNVTPADRPLGTDADFVAYGDIGLYRYDSDGNFVLEKAFGEQYDTGDCTPP